jgi:hypothetical protein
MSSLAETTLVSPLAEPFASVDQLLREPREVLGRVRDGRALLPLARAMVLTIVLGAGIFGAVIGSFRGGLQLLYAGVKLPLVLLLTTAICAPALSALNVGLGRRAELRADLALVLCALARTSLALGAQAPVVLLAVRLGISYHGLVLLAVGCCGGSAAVGLSLFAAGLRESGARGVGWASLALLLVFGLVGSQLAWTLRPFMVRPRTPVAPFVRGVEGSFLDAVGRSVLSARGIYSRDEAPLPGEEGSR